MIYMPEFYTDNKRVQLTTDYTITQLLADEWIDAVREHGLSMLLWYAQHQIDRDYEDADWLWSKMEEIQQVKRYSWGSNLRYYIWAIQKVCVSIIEQWRPE